ncbi:MAG: hypothetical protein KBC48_02270 [Candidatus Pacebacteria bacterium]|nr:hypothetical protein [Candidatus Paceibacterota bacterium]
MHISTPKDEEKRLRELIAERPDSEARRMERFLAMSDLTRADGPIKELTSRITGLPDFKAFDIIEVPEINSTEITFDLFNFKADHPARSKSDTYFADDNHILRPHTTVMWYYYLNLPEVKERLIKNEDIGVFCYGKVYRKDEIDRTHMNVFHQIDALYLTPKNKKVLSLEDLQNVEASVVKAVFGENIEYRFHEETFPYTHPSTEIEIKKDGKWVEILGSGVVNGDVLEKLGVDSNQYNGWAFGFGLERWAIISMELPDIRLLWSDDERVKKQLNLGQKFKEVSKYPAITRDISFIVPKTFVANDYFDLIRDIGGDLVEEVELLDKYENDEKFGKEKMSYTYRIVYRSIDRTLKSEEIDPLQAKVEAETIAQFHAEIR